jgi:hypothetical protein
VSVRGSQRYESFTQSGLIQMMTPPSRQLPDDEQLVAYLLGDLPEQHTEQIDELSVADDELALRLRALEHDLVDAYVSGQLEGRRRERFETSYLTSPVRRQRVEFARALRSHAHAAAPPRLSGLAAPTWTLAAAALLVAVIGAGYLALQNGRLRQQVEAGRSAQVRAEAAVQNLQAELQRQRSARVEPPPTAAPSPPLPGIQALVLMPLRRGAGDLPTVALNRGSTSLPLRVRLEGGDDASHYRATVGSATAGEAIWRSDWIVPVSSAGGREVAILLPAAALLTGNYTLELTGRRRNAAEEFAGSYAFRVVVE